MRNLGQAFAALSLSLLLAPPALAEGETPKQEAFPDKESQASSSQLTTGAYEVLLGATVNTLFVGDTDLKILAERQAYAQYQLQAEKEIAAKSPAHGELLKAERRIKEIDEFEKQNGGLDDARRLERADHKLKLHDAAAEHKEARRMVESRRQALMADVKIPVKPGVWMRPDLAHRREMMKLYLQKAGLSGVALVVAADGALRIGAALSGRDTAFDLRGAIQEGTTPRPKVAPASQSGATPASTAMEIK